MHRLMNVMLDIRTYTAVQVTHFSSLPLLMK